MLNIISVYEMKLIFFLKEICEIIVDTNLTNFI